MDDVVTGRGARHRGGKRAAMLLACAGLLSLAAGAAAQDLEPRAYSASPVGLNFFAIAFGRSSGSVVFDPSLPITDVTAHIDSVSIGAGRTFGIFGRQALLTAGVPYAWGDVEGKVQEQQARITRSGFGDLRAKLSVNLYGNPARTPQEFAKAPRTFLVAASLTIQAPVGQYFPSKLINLGTNRWAFKPEVGVSIPWNKFDLELYGGVWFFTDNPNFYPGANTRQQDPLETVQAHASYTFLPGLWLALDGTWYGGGASMVNNGPPTAKQNNTRYGATLSVPLSKGQSFKIAYSKGGSVRSGTDFGAITAGVQFRWF